MNIIVPVLFSHIEKIKGLLTLKTILVASNHMFSKAKVIKIFRQSLIYVYIYTSQNKGKHLRDYILHDGAKDKEKIIHP